MLLMVFLITVWTTITLSPQRNSGIAFERKVRAESYYCAMDGPNIRRILAYRSHLGLLVR